MYTSLSDLRDPTTRAAVQLKLAELTREMLALGDAGKTRAAGKLLKVVRQIRCDLEMTTVAA